jgi:hypothetical protein
MLQKPELASEPLKVLLSSDASRSISDAHVLSPSSGGLNGPVMLLLCRSRTSRNGKCQLYGRLPDILLSAIANVLRGQKG